MSKRFEVGKKYVFTKKKYIRDMGKKTYKIYKSWVDKCNGRIVIINSPSVGDICGYSINSKWCKEVKTMSEENTKELKKSLVKANTIINALHRENISANKKALELENKCNNLIDIISELQRKIDELINNPPKDKKQSIVGFLKNLGKKAVNGR